MTMKLDAQPTIADGQHGHACMTMHEGGAYYTDHSKGKGLARDFISVGM